MRNKKSFSHIKEGSVHGDMMDEEKPVGDMADTMMMRLSSTMTLVISHIERYQDPMVTREHKT